MQIATPSPSPRKRHLYIHNECLGAITSPVVRAVQTFVADCVAGFIGDDFPSQAMRDWAARELRAWRRATPGEARAVMRLDYLPNVKGARVSTCLAYWVARHKAGVEAFIADRIDGRTLRAEREKILREVAKL